ncbi:LLM class F420-dependent oxidoreductase [Gordonia iterans]|uniref:LLM class F420-dependent oxidoreductase n=1 Tax=Gordonia iterans TaxID=1004901 RepID=A0A2S0KBW2_9ACTN|nr:LLM class F420-dependent oxidoreductase [Gordonia iterans]AVL99130.1 LLM class F420-dependent oxidoreductase [Gordonia iterans]
MAFRTRIGVQLQPQHAPDYGLLRDAVVRAEDLGVDVIFNWDHFYPLYGDPEGAHFECWTMLGAWAEQTERVEFGPLVTCNSYRNPDLLADMARTVDHISGGRLILGIGSGWFERDYDEYGYSFGTKGSRLDALGESLPRITARVSELNPVPVRDIPIMIGGGGPKKTLPLVAEYASIWHSFVSVDTYREKSVLLDGYCADLGRDPSTIERSAEIRYDGDVAKTLGFADAITAEGVSLLTVATGGPDYDLSAAKLLCEWRDRNR